MKNTNITLMDNHQIPKQLFDEKRDAQRVVIVDTDIQFPISIKILLGIQIITNILLFFHK